MLLLEALDVESQLSSRSVKGNTNTKLYTFTYIYLQLIQRLYNLEKGDMRIENANSDAVNVPWLRSKLGLVSQVVI